MIARLRSRLGSIPPTLVTIVSILFLNNVAVAAARALLPIYVERDLGMSPAFTSLLVSLETVMGGLISVTAGALADRLGHRLVLVIGILGFSAGLLQYLTGVPWLLVALAVILGLAHGMRSTSGQSYLLTASSRQSVGVATAAYFLGGTIGMSASSAVAGPVVERFGFAAYALVGLGLNLVPAAVTLRYLRDVRPKRPVGSIDEGTWSVLMRREVWLMGGLRFVSTAFWGVWSLAMPLLMFRATASVLPPALLYGTVGMSLAAVSQFLIGHWSDRGGRTVPVYVVLGLQFVLALVAALAWRSIPVLMVTGIAGVVTGWTMSVLVLGVVRDRTAPLERGRVVGFVHALWSFGILAGTVIAGTLIDVDPGLPLAIGALANLAALAIAAVLFHGGRLPAPDAS
ncbi:MAG: MFS transporter [Chloroflexi bacterium]|nr:MFS transporter [Chloroflexota bacterium]